MANQRRVFKIGERIQGLIATELLRVADPRFFLVTITSVVVSSDMRNAKVYWMVNGDQERRSEVEDAFVGAQGMFRKLISRELGIRFIPVVKFFYDDTVDVTAQVESLFSRIQKQQTAQEHEDPVPHEDESVG